MTYFTLIENIQHFESFWSSLIIEVGYTLHVPSLLITNLSWILSIHKGRISLNLGKTVLTVLPNSIQKESTIRFRDFRNLILPFYSLVFFRHFLRMLRLVVFSSKTKSYQEQKTREIAMAKPAKVFSNNSCVDLSLILQCTHGRRKVHERILRFSRF